MRLAGAKLSVQMHHHRAEHWVVMSGTARVTNGDKTYLVTENESTFIPVGQVHSLENPDRIPLELIEVQSGSYLGKTTSFASRTATAGNDPASADAAAPVPDEILIRGSTGGPRSARPRAPVAAHRGGHALCRVHRGRGVGAGPE